MDPEDASMSPLNIFNLLYNGSFSLWSKYADSSLFWT